MSVTEILIFVQHVQKQFHEQIVASLEKAGSEHALTAHISLLAIGFLYGVLHAVGPGHGKVVVTSYVLANESTLKRGLLVVVCSSLLQAITAVAIVLGYYTLLHATKNEASYMAVLLETASAVMIALIGLWLMLQGLLTVKKLLRTQDHGHVCRGGCGHAHAPPPETIAGGNNFYSLAGMIVSIGMRPCTGALLLLYFSCALHLVLSGVLAVFAMAAGTALTTGILATLAVKFKEKAIKYAGNSERHTMGIEAALRFFGGLIIFLVALLLVMAGTYESPAGGKMQPTHPLFRGVRSGS